MSGRDRVAGARVRRVAVASMLAAAAFAVTVARPVAADPSFDLSGALARDADAVAGKEALARKDWSAATRRLSQALVRHPDDADLHNDLGYAYRNQKQLDRALEHYKRAIALDPRHRGAHEYIGEAYLMMGDLASAEKHLDVLRAICLLPCDELADLEKAVVAYRTVKGAPSGKGTGAR